MLVANPQNQKLQGYLGAFPIMESDVFNWLIWAWHPSEVLNPPSLTLQPLGWGPACRLRAETQPQNFSLFLI